MHKKVTTASIPFIFFVIIITILVQSSCQKFELPHFQGLEKSIQTARNQSKQINQETSQFQSYLQQMRQCGKCFQDIKNILDSPHIIHTVDQEEKLQKQLFLLKSSQQSSRKQDISQYQIVKNNIKILLLQKSLAYIQLQKIKKTLAQTQNQLEISKNKSNQIQQKLKVCLQRECINDCGKCPCPTPKGCDKCQNDLELLKKQYATVKNEAQTWKNQNENRKNKISQYEEQQKKQKQTLKQLIPKVNNQLNYAISSQSISKFNLTKVSTILNEINSLQTSTQNPNPNQKLNKYQSLANELVYYVNVSTKAYSEVVDQRNGLLLEAKKILATLKDCNKVLKNEK